MKDITIIGKTIKPHGVKGWLRLLITPPFEDDLERATVLFLKKGSQAIPYFIKQFDKESAQILLEDIDSKEAAQALSKLEIFLKNKDIIPIENRHTDAEQSYLSLIGYSIIASGDKLGIIDSIQAFPQQDMAFIDYKGKEVLIPLNNAYIQSIDSEKRSIEMILPEGFLDLF